MRGDRALPHPSCRHAHSRSRWRPRRNRWLRTSRQRGPRSDRNTVPISAGRSCRISWLDRGCVRYPCELAFDADPLLPGECAFPVPTRRAPGGRLPPVRAPLLSTEPARVPLLALYQLVSRQLRRLCLAGRRGGLRRRRAGNDKEEYYETLCAHGRRDRRRSRARGRRRRMPLRRTSGLTARPAFFACSAARLLRAAPAPSRERVDFPTRTSLGGPPASTGALAPGPPAARAQRKGAEPQGASALKTGGLRPAVRVNT
jgi:hypothetical protein